MYRGTQVIQRLTNLLSGFSWNTVDSGAPSGKFTWSNENRCKMIDTLIDLLIDWLVDWLIDTFIDTLIDLLIDWLIDTLIDLLIDLLIDWLIDWLILWLICWSICWLICWLIDTLIDWLIESTAHLEYEHWILVKKSFRPLKFNHLPFLKQNIIRKRETILSKILKTHTTDKVTLTHKTIQQKKMTTYSYFRIKLDQKQNLKIINSTKTCLMRKCMPLHREIFKKILGNTKNTKTSRKARKKLREKNVPDRVRGGGTTRFWFWAVNDLQDATSASAE